MRLDSIRNWSNPRSLRSSLPIVQKSQFQVNWRPSLNATWCVRGLTNGMRGYQKWGPFLRVTRCSHARKTPDLVSWLQNPITAVHRRAFSSAGVTADARTGCAAEFLVEGPPYYIDEGINLGLEEGEVGWHGESGLLIMGLVLRCAWLHGSWWWEAWEGSAARRGGAIAPAAGPKAFSRGLHDMKQLKGERIRIVIKGQFYVPVNRRLSRITFTCHPDR